MSLFTWPENHEFGATISFDFDAEEVWIGENPDNASKPGVLSQGTYGPKRAVPLILDILDRHDVTASFFVPGKDAERHSEVVRSIIAAGHEIGHHGYTHTSPTDLSQEQEELELRKGREVLERLGAAVAGYRSPSWEFSAHTLDLLEANGFTYSSNLLDDIVPYKHENHEVAEVPVSWLLDDAPHFWFANDEKTIRSPREVLDCWLPEIDGIAELGGHVMVTMHPMIIGRPSRLKVLESTIERLKERGAWFGTAGEVAGLVPALKTRQSS
ncbi:polysaccharide deacetylase [Brevibacterium sanguinis]|uniref:Polysaccharide deacetylase n=2 Tax=Brevibacterium TaxID=1696 RepID=A0A366IH51_9MICO|nr:MULTISPECIES: polysaccharide deacetylase [Brevibacterium]RBP64920.1 polysaccharide deacetylase [Brevibacterium sanguinis]RBP71183.1 polysaccharide deacetylase [Brevibacterium celere]